MMTLIAALIVSAAIAWAANKFAAGRAAGCADARKTRTLSLIQLFAPSVAAAQSDPRAILVWEPLMRAARAVCPEEFATLDQAADGAFPFSAKQIEAAHAQWTADWLAWERTHDAQYKLRAAEAEHALASEPSNITRARLESIEREKLELYQRRYEEYIRVAKALQGLSTRTDASRVSS